MVFCSPGLFIFIQFELCIWGFGAWDFTLLVCSLGRKITPGCRRQPTIPASITSISNVSTHAKRSYSRVASTASLHRARQILRCRFFVIAGLPASRVLQEETERALARSCCLHWRQRSAKTKQPSRAPIITSEESSTICVYLAHLESESLN